MDVVDAWDISRDARKYDGPYPIVAHPPCGPWSRLRHLCKHQDPELAIIAVDQLRTYGGVLEHPAQSKLWDACRLPRPGELSYEPDIWTLEVDQVRWGHVARKRTWLLFCGVPKGAIGQIPPDREPTHWVSAPARVRRSNPDRRACSAQQARRTPPAFARWLVSLAKRASMARDIEE
jgi:hypothetical protein